MSTLGQIEDGKWAKEDLNTFVCVDMLVLNLKNVRVFPIGERVSVGATNNEKRAVK